MKPEQKFKSQVISQLHGHVQLIESMVGRGVPDMYWCIYEKPCWVEFKVEVPKLGVLLRPEQNAWCVRNQANGGKVFLVALYVTRMVGIYQFPVKCGAPVHVWKKLYIPVVGCPDISCPIKETGKSLLSLLVV